MINAQEVTIKYPNGKGVYNIDFSVCEGTVMGYLGPNGAGKTTTIRGFMGFIKPDHGKCTIDSKDCFKYSSEINKILGYMPGEIFFPPNFTCNEFLKFQKDLHKIKDNQYVKDLIDRFDLHAEGYINNFSKGMKQKLAIVTAFMHDPKVLILDEPTSGLDPLMQNEFITLIKEEKQKGKTILLSSHIFEEIEKTCDNVLIIKNGKLIAKDTVTNLTKEKKTKYIITTRELDRLKSFELNADIIGHNQAEISVTDSEIDHVIKKLSELFIENLEIKTQSLEEIFMHYYEVKNDDK